MTTDEFEPLNQHKHNIKIIQQQLIQPTAKHIGTMRTNTHLNNVARICQGRINPIKRLVIEQWLDTENIDILVLQEANVKTHEKEARGNAYGTLAPTSRLREKERDITNNTQA